MIKINFNRFVEDCIPFPLRSTQIINDWLQYLVYPVKRLYNNFVPFYNETIYLLQHTGQISSLEHILNNKLNILGKPIYIGEGFNKPVNFVCSDNKQDIKLIDFYDYQNGLIQYNPTKLYIGNDGSTIQPDKKFWVTSDNNVDSDPDFIVWVDNVDYVTNVNGIKYYVDKLKLAGSKYIIKTY